MRIAFPDGVTQDEWQRVALGTVAPEAKMLLCLLGLGGGPRSLSEE